MAEQTMDTPSRILDAALELFTTRGYQRTSLRQIAERLGITKAAVLYHFPAKDRILTALTAPMLRDLEAALDAAERLDPTAARWAAIEGLLDAFLTHRQALLTARHDLSILTQQREVYQRFLHIGLRAHRVVAGPDAGLAELIRASQAIACLGDPVIYFPDAPLAELREHILEGARWMLAGGAATARPAERPGRRLGRPRALDDERLAAARRMYAAGGRSVAEVAATIGVSRATLYRHLHASGDRATSETSSEI